MKFPKFMSRVQKSEEGSRITSFLLFLQGMDLFRVARGSECQLLRLGKWAVTAHEPGLALRFGYRDLARWLVYFRPSAGGQSADRPQPSGWYSDHSVFSARWLAEGRGLMPQMGEKAFSHASGQTK